MPLNDDAKNERSNNQIIKLICNILDNERPHFSPHFKLINYIKDRPGHDRRYAIDPSKIKNELGWKPKYQLEERLETTVNWYIKNKKWSEELINKLKNKP